MADITIKKVTNTPEMNKFIRLPWKIYKNDEVWVAPIKSQYKHIFDKKRNPFFIHGDADFFIAEKNGEVVGRIAAITNRLHNETWKDKVGFFGFFECINDQDVANALIEAAAKHLKALGFDQLRGPASPSSNEDYGVLIDNFKSQHVLLSTYNAPYYYDLYQRAGLAGIKELYAIKFPGLLIREKSGERLSKLRKAVMERTGISFESLDMKKFKEAVTTFKGLFNEAWTTVNNHGWVPLTDAEFDVITGDLKQITDPDLVMLARVDGKVVGGVICLPDYNEIFRSWKGNIFPFHWIDMFTKKKKIKCLRIVILGVLPEYQKKGLDAIMYYEILERGLAKGMDWAEASYIVEDNMPMFKPLMNIGGEIYKTYKVMEKNI
jgi:GNAT superfamily N-acetyltransferase